MIAEALLISIFMSAGTALRDGSSFLDIKFVSAPVRSVAEFIVGKMRPVRKEEAGENKSLIDE